MQRVLIIKQNPESLINVFDDMTMAGYFVSFAKDTQKALKKIKKGRFDLILIDGNDSRNEGYDVLAGLRRGGVANPVMIVTDQEYELDRVISSHLPGIHPLEESQGQQELLQHLRTILKRTNGNKKAPEKYQFGNVVINFKTYEATKKGKRVPLTPLEFELLLYMVSRKNEALRREEIVDAVWGEEVIVDNRTVDTHIARLRKKLCDNPQKPEFFVSIRGIGYRFLG